MRNFFKINIGQRVADRLKKDLKIGVRRGQTPEHRNRNLCEGGRQRIARTAGKDLEGRKNSHRLAGRPNTPSVRWVSKTTWRNSCTTRRKTDYDSCSPRAVM
jgi:hypothetical protein